MTPEQIEWAVAITAFAIVFGWIFQDQVRKWRGRDD